MSFTADSMREPLRCYPSRPDGNCLACARYRAGNPAPAEQRRLPVIDASLFRRDCCDLFRARLVAQPFNERKEATHA